MRSYLLVPLALTYAFAAPPAWLAGDWVNANPETGGITRLKTEAGAAGMRIAAWGKCSPVDCDWGYSEIGEKDGFPIATWNAGFAITRLHFGPAPGGRLVVVMTAEYKDNSGRKSPDAVEVFVKEDPGRSSPEEKAARALLERASERLRRLETAYFEADSHSEAESDTSSQRSNASLRIWVGDRGRLRLEREEGGGRRTIELVDEKSQWRIDPSGNEYTVLPRPSDRFSRTPLQVLAMAGHLPGKLSGMGEEEVDGRACRKLVLAAGRGAEHRFWVEESSARIWRYEMFAQTEERTRLQRLTFRRIDEAARPGEELFVYDPAVTKAVSRDAARSAAAGEPVGRPAPDFELTGLDGRTVRLSELRGKTVLLDFWATWCGACRSALPGIELLHRQFKDKGLAVLAISSEEAGTQRGFLEKNRYTLAALHDAGEHVAGRYGVAAYPTTVLIGPTGNILWRRVGSEGEEEIHQQLLKLGLW